MRTVGVIVEYNPLHNGHLYHLQQSKKITGAEAAVAVMSGHFLQRGEPAIADKWARAEMALRAGCDLVLELPVAYSAQPAQWFAYGAVAILEATGVVDALCFGSESGDVTALDAVAGVLSDEPGTFAAALNAELKKGVPYPSAYTSAARELLAARGLSDFAFSLEQPNHTLGLHYLIALRQLRSRIVPYTVRREKSGYGQTDITDAAIASATALRRRIAESGSWDEIAPFVPSFTLEILKREAGAGRAPVDWESFARPLFHELLRSDAADLSLYAEVTEGLEYRIRRAAAELSEWSVESLLAHLKTKRYTRTKLQRTLVRILLGHGKELLSPARLAEGPGYIRVLGFTPRGRELLRDMRKRSAVPVADSAARGGWSFLAMDARASAVYSLAFGSPDPAAALRDYTQPPLQI
ncbi:nucleotidyltransferase [Cohnella sp. CFH 77786]|uniref:nucleotidyltransferase n=1 Tax=Cohnella sp. CFH 77786 TaxID=2662265 RepID=UPI001C60CFCE|nr:nucleotidyltransferase [Cohnella sp. CFH 77786]MBW5444620.1 nucleotidyltransferase [Cohnella sp. CFH 77786]